MEILGEKLSRVCHMFDFSSDKTELGNEVVKFQNFVTL
jgi:hypothetical protein